MRFMGYQIQVGMLVVEAVAQRSTISNEIQRVSISGRYATVWGHSLQIFWFSRLGSSMVMRCVWASPWYSGLDR
jgi:hypothetical protein